MSSPFDAVSAYFFAKDGNRPHLMRRAFTRNAKLEMVVKTDDISFPESATGMDAIEDMIGRRFANEYENVYTFGLARPTAAYRHHFPCPWLAGMSAKNNGPIRVGCGRYDWYFTEDQPCLVERLVITIDVMKRFPATRLEDLMTWLSGLPYPWCMPAQALNTMPDFDGLAVVERYLNDIRPLSPN